MDDGGTREAPRRQHRRQPRRYTAGAEWSTERRLTSAEPSRHTRDPAEAPQEEPATSHTRCDKGDASRDPSACSETTNSEERIHWGPSRMGPLWSGRPLRICPRPPGEQTAEAPASSNRQCRHDSPRNDGSPDPPLSPRRAWTTSAINMAIAHRDARPAPGARSQWDDTVVDLIRAADHPGDASKASGQGFLRSLLSQSEAWDATPAAAAAGHTNPDRLKEIIDILHDGAGRNFLQAAAGRLKEADETLAAVRAGTLPMTDDASTAGRGDDDKAALNQDTGI